jgi:hypothetical protein
LIVFSAISIFYSNRAITAFEDNLRSDIWSAKFSVFNISLSIVGICIALASNLPQLNMAFFWVFQFVFFGLGGLLIQLDPYPYYLSLIPSQEDLISASQITFAANIFVLTAQIFSLIKFRKAKSHIKQIQFNDYAILLKRVNHLLAIYLVVLPIVLLQLGGFDFLFKRIRVSEVGETLSISVNAIFLAILYVPPMIAILILLYVRPFMKTSNWIFRSLFIWVILLSNPIGNARQTTLFMLLPLAFFFLSKMRKFITMFFVFVTLFFLFAAGLVNRYTGEFQKPKLSIISRDGDFDAFAQLANGLKAVSFGVFPILQQILGSVFFFVPRSIWDGKPIDTGVEVAQTFSLKFQNLSAPWILEAYVNGRLIGVVLISIFIGLQLTKLDLGAKINIRQFILSSMISGLSFILLRGSLLQATGRAAFSLMIIFYLFRGITPANKKYSQL